MSTIYKICLDSQSKDAITIPTELRSLKKDDFYYEQKDGPKSSLPKRIPDSYNEDYWSLFIPGICFTVVAVRGSNRKESLKSLKKLILKKYHRMYNLCMINESPNNNPLSYIENDILNKCMIETGIAPFTLHIDTINLHNIYMKSSTEPHAIDSASRKLIIDMLKVTFKIFLTQ